MTNRLKGYLIIALYLLHQMDSLDTECVMVMANYHRSDFDDVLKSILEVPFACMHTLLPWHASVRIECTIV